MTGILFLFLAMFCQNPKHTTATRNCPLIHVNHVNTLGEDGSDDTGHVPPKPPVPPAPPPTIP